ncbi:MAG TPA: DUF3224 domain-containing protein [Devosiaceae bacterium]|nr:DUF3224 domain-containing protein [Devosiaceae bacterium]
MPTIKGEFDVKTLPQAPEPDPGFAAVSRLLLDKQFHGPLEAVSRGQMLAVGGEGGWGVYVAIEKVEGALEGRRGTFILYHNGTMMPAEGQRLAVTVAPGSGTGDLAGLSGQMAIEITDGRHFYSFDYALG